MIKAETRDRREYLAKVLRALAATLPEHLGRDDLNEAADALCSRSMYTCTCTETNKCEGCIFAEQEAEIDAERIFAAGCAAGRKERDVLRAALALLATDVTAYEAWQRPCYALDVARAALRSIAALAPLVFAIPGARWMAWVKGFAAFKKNVSVAYAWEPVIVKPARKPVVSTRLVGRDWIQEGITLKRGMTGAKPERVCHWAFEMVGAHPEDDLYDLYPGNGAVTRAWSTWQRKFTLPAREL